MVDLRLARGIILTITITGSGAGQVRTQIVVGVRADAVRIGPCVVCV